MVTPDLIIAGAPKCGTTSVFDWLSGHPEICPSSVKETYFLMDKGYPLFRPENNYHKDGIAGYESFFSDCDEESSLLLEATPDYLYQKTALDVIGALPNSPRVLVILRKPSDRVYSLFQFARNNVSVIDKKMEFSDFVEVTTGNDRHGVFDKRPILQNAVKHSQYVDYLEPWIARMGSRVKVGLFEDMRADPESFMVSVCEYFEIDGEFFEDLGFSPKNKTYGVKSQSLHLMKKKLSSMLPDGAYRQVLRNCYKKLNTRALVQKTSEDMEALKILDEHFSEFNGRLEALTGLDLSSWRA